MEPNEMKDSFVIARTKRCLSARKDSAWAGFFNAVWMKRAPRELSMELMPSLQQLEK
jgi:hypothetical protein